MKRSEALARLSRDHHEALEAALRLRRATPADAQAAVERLQDFWDRRGRRHFEIEEQLILPALPEADERWAAMATRVREEHADIRRRTAELGEGEPLVAAARELGERLHAHVRFEERELFAHLEQHLDGASLERLGRAVDDAE